MSAVNLTAGFHYLQEEVGKLIRVETLDDTEAVAAAKELANLATTYLREICESKDESFKQTLKERNIPLPIAYKTIKLLTKPELQFNDKLKEQLSKTTRTFFELIICQCHAQERSLYPSTHEKFLDTFKEMIEALPKKEVLCRYELKCCRAALHNFSSVTEDAAAIAKKNIIPVTIGAALTVFSANASPPYVNPAPAIVSMAQVVNDVYKVMPEWWYGSVLALKLRGLEWGLKNLSQYTSEQPKHSTLLGKAIGKASGQTLKEMLIEFSSNPNLAFYTCQIFKIVIDNPDADSDLKMEVLENPQLSIAYLTQIKKKPWKFDNHWKVRYLALCYLGELINDEKYKNEEEDPLYCTDAMREAAIKRLSSSKERKFIRLKAQEVCEALLKVETSRFLSAVQKIQQYSVEKLEEAKKNEVTPEIVQTSLEKTKANIKDIGKQLKKFSKGRKAHSGGSGDPVEDLNEEKRLKENLEIEQKNEETWLKRKEYLDETLAQYNLLEEIKTTGSIDGINIK